MSISDFASWTDESLQTETETEQVIVIPAGVSMPIILDSPKSVQSLQIEKDGELVISTSKRTWAMLRVKGDVRLQGRIRVSQLPTPAGVDVPNTISQTGPDGTELSHSFIYVLGGRGGDGGTLGPAIGGRGEQAGTTTYGGGGGSGGGNNGVRGGPYINGNPGAGRNGGAANLGHKLWGGAGGDGAQHDTKGDGGLFYLRVEGSLDGAAGQIDAQGRAGEPGGDGQPGQGAGGGGGGGPGCPGGSIVIACATIATVPTVNVNGGSGGPGGKGAGSLNQFPGGYIPAGHDGDHGNQGIPGEFVQILPPW